MSTQKQKFELFLRLQSLGFTYEESQQLRRIETTLRRWAEAECNGDIQRDEKTGKPYRPSRTSSMFTVGGYAVADREAGALKRLAAILYARNVRTRAAHPDQSEAGKFARDSADVLHYHQTDPRGCALYLLTRPQLDGKPIDQVYNRGLAVTA
jgi:hypothetical protein